MNATLVLVDEIMRRLIDGGLRPTPHRLAVVRALVDRGTLDGHTTIMTAESGRPVGRAIVRRVIVDLLRAGVIEPAPGADGGYRLRVAASTAEPRL